MGIRGRVGRVIAGVAVVGGALLVDPSTVAADGGLDVVATTTYTVDLPNGVVHTVIDLTFTNEVPDETRSDGVYSTYFTGYTFGIHADATAVAATIQPGGAPVAVTVTPENAELHQLGVEFPSNLDFRESIDVRITYDLAGFAPRSDVLTRANAAFASFPIFAIGDPGQSTVQVIAPREVELTARYVEGAPDVPAAEFGTASVLTYEALADPYAFFAWASAVDHDALTTTTATAGDIEVIVRAWPDDPDWAAFMQTEVPRSLTTLSELIGRPVPERDSIEVMESATPEFEGYGGWFDPLTGRIEMGEVFDPVITAHELAHAWFTDDTVAGRWLVEGFAETMANATVEAGGGTPTPAEAPPTVLMPLNEWSTSDTAAEEPEREDHGYATSYFVIDEIRREIGPDRMRAVLDAAFARESAYGPGAAGSNPDRPTWREMLDLFEEVGGSTRSTDLFTTYVVRPSEAPDLAERAPARAAYEAVVDQGGEWEAPLVLREAMDEWRFEDAATAAESSVAVLERDARLDAVRTATGLGLPDLGERYADADDVEDLEAVSDHLDDLATAADGVVAADAALATAGDGLVLPDLDDDFAAADDIADLDALAGHLDDLTVAATAVVAAEDALDRPLTADERLGLVGADLHAMVGDAAAALAADDPSGAIAAADEVQATLTGAAAAGRQRAQAMTGDVPEDRRPVVIGVAAGAVALAIAVVALVLVLRRRAQPDPASPVGRSPLDEPHGHEAGERVPEGREGTREAQPDPASPVGRSPERLRGVVADVDAGGDAPVDGEVGVGVDDRVDLDEDALPGAVLGGVDGPLEVAHGHEGEGSGATGVVEWPAPLGHVGDPVLELDEDVGAVVDAQTVAGAEVLVDPDTHDPLDGSGDEPDAPHGGPAVRSRP